MTNLEILKEMLNEAIRESNKLSEEKNRLLWSYRGRNLTHQEFAKQRELLVRKQQELSAKIEQIDFRLKLEELKLELSKNRYLTVRVRSLIQPRVDQPQLLTETIKLPCQHRLNLIQHIEDLRRNDKIKANHLLLNLLNVIRTCQKIDRAQGYTEIPVKCSTCKAEFAMTIKLEPIPNE